MAAKMSASPFPNDCYDGFTAFGGKAYTEDKILIRTLYVCKIPSGIQESVMIQQFSVFGAIESVRRINANGGNANPRRFHQAAFLTFVDPADALRALRIGYLKINGKNVVIKPADSWHQPDIQATSSKGRIIMNTEGRSLLTLGYDVLHIIFNYLPLKDRIICSRVSKSMCEIFVAHGKRPTHCLNDVEKLTLMEARDMYRLLGQYMKKLTGNLCHRQPDRLTAYISKYCTNVQTIDLHNIRIKDRLFWPMISQMKKLEEVRLSACSFENDIFRKICNKPKMKRVSFIDNFQLIGFDVVPENVIQEMSLRSCSNLQNRLFIGMVSFLPNLKLLDVHGCPHLTRTAFLAIFTHCKDLENFTFDTMAGESLEVVGQMKKLKHLQMVDSARLIELRQTFYEQLLEHNCLESLLVSSYKVAAFDHLNLVARITTLKEIKLRCDIINDYNLLPLLDMHHLEALELSSKNVTKHGLLKLLTALKKLKKMNLSNCHKVENDFVFDAIDVLRRTSMERTLGVLELTCSCTGITRDILEHEQYTSAKHVIKITNITLRNNVLVRHGSQSPELNNVHLTDDEADEDSFSDYDSEHGFDFDSDDQDDFMDELIDDFLFDNIYVMQHFP